MKYKKALVTGGAGFIGSNLIERLLHEGLKVICVDNLLSGKLKNMKEFRDNPNFKFYLIDVRNKDKLDNLVNGCDIIFNQMASKKTICENNPQMDLDINAKGTLNLLELAVKHKVKKFVHASTGSVYGEAIIIPETEKHPLNPVSYYGVSKLAGERYVCAFNKLYNLNTTVLRYFHVYGKKQDYSDKGGVVAIFINRIMNNQPINIFGTGDQERVFTHVCDVVNANVFVANNPKTNGEVYNISYGLSYTLKQLIYMIETYSNKKATIKYKDWMLGDIVKFDISSKKIKDMGFKFKVSLQDGLKGLIK